MIVPTLTALKRSITPSEHSPPRTVCNFEPMLTSSFMGFLLVSRQLEMREQGRTDLLGEEQRSQVVLRHKPAALSKNRLTCAAVQLTMSRHSEYLHVSRLRHSPQF